MELYLFLPFAAKDSIGMKTSWKILSAITTQALTEATTHLVMQKIGTSTKRTSLSPKLLPALRACDGRKEIFSQSV